MQKLVTRSEVARMAHVSAAAVTKACAAALKPAVVGRRVDAAHPAVLKFIADNDPAKADAPDPLLEAAREWARVSGRPTANALRGQFGIGYKRATRLAAELKLPASGQPPAKGTKPPKEAPHKRGHTVAREKKKRSGNAPPGEGQLWEVPEDIEAFLQLTLRELVERFGTDVRFLDWLKATREIEMINEKRLKNAQTRGELVSRDLVKRGVLEPVESAHLKMLTDGSKTIARRATAMQAAGRAIEEIEAFVEDQISSHIRPMKAKIARALRDA